MSNCHSWIHLLNRIHLLLLCCINWRTTKAFGLVTPLNMGMSTRFASLDMFLRQPRRPSAIVFDIDGTLCNSFQLGYSATNSVLKKHGFQEASADDYHYGTRYSTPERLARHTGLCPVRDSDSFSSTGAFLGKEFDDLYIGLVDPSTAPLFEGIEELLSECSRMTKVGALSNAAVAYVEKVLEVHNLSKSFSVMHGADDVPAPKPSPDGLLTCAKDLEEHPSSIIYVGDSPSDGIAARLAGMKSIGVTWGSHSKESLEESFDTVVGSVAELRAVLMQAVNFSAVRPAVQVEPMQVEE